MFLLFEKEKEKLNINIPIWKRTKEKINIRFQTGKKFLSRKAIWKITPQKKRQLDLIQNQNLYTTKNYPKWKEDKLGKICTVNKIR